MLRLFVAVPLPARARQHLALLSGGVPNARWARPEGLHLTLRFIGDVDYGTMDDIDAGLLAVGGAPFDLALSGVGVFGASRSKGAHALWAGVEPSPELEALRDRVESAVVRSGQPAETRKFSPHVTLARLRDAPDRHLHAFLQHNAMLRIPGLRVDRFTLFSSHASREGQIYRPEADYPLEN